MRIFGRSGLIRKRTTIALLLSVLVSGIGLFSYRAFAMPLPLASVSVYTPSLVSGEVAALPWPANGQSAIGSLAEGVLANSNKSETPVPIASIAKVITALTVLEKKPLKLNEDGPLITLTTADVDIYNRYVKEGGSTAKVEAGESLSERQILEGMLLPSANNLADSAALWAYGSVEAYARAANELVTSWGLTKTTVRDASGFADTTLSTASELVQIGQKALGHPVLASIVQEKETVLPVAGLVTNTNTLLGSGGVGIKTGHTNAAGACLLFATNYAVSEKTTITIIGAVLAQPSMNDVFAAASSLLTASKKNFSERTIVSKGERVASYRSSWGAITGLSATDALVYTGWNGIELDVHTVINEKPSVNQGEESGVVSLKTGSKTQSVTVTAENGLGSPSLFWRLGHGHSW